MGQWHAFGLARRPGGIEQQGEILRRRSWKAAGGIRQVSSPMRALARLAVEQDVIQTTSRFVKPASQIRCRTGPAGPALSQNVLKLFSTDLSLNGHGDRLRRDEREADNDPFR